MNKNIKIVKAFADQSGEIAKVCILTWQDAYRGIVLDEFLDSMTPDRHEKIMRENLRNGSEDIFVAVENEKIVGFIALRKQGSEGYDTEIPAIYILPEYQGYGVGKRLFEKAFETIKGYGFKSVILWVLEDNSAVNFYKKMGGKVKKKSTRTIGSQTLNILGFVWEDICRGEMC